MSDQNEFGVIGNVKEEKTFPITIIKEEEFYVVICPALGGISSYGKTVEEATHNFNEALLGSLYLMQVDGTLGNFI